MEANPQTTGFWPTSTLRYAVERARPWLRILFGLLRQDSCHKQALGQKEPLRGPLGSIMALWTRYEICTGLKELSHSTLALPQPC